VTPEVVHEPPLEAFSRCQVARAAGRAERVVGATALPRVCVARAVRAAVGARVADAQAFLRVALKRVVEAAVELCGAPVQTGSIAAALAGVAHVCVAQAVRHADAVTRPARRVAHVPRAAVRVRRALLHADEGLAHVRNQKWLERARAAGAARRARHLAVERRRVIAVTPGPT
jgi:hypothetical protein